jgi:hemoglobin-like flavoprotein
MKNRQAIFKAYLSAASRSRVVADGLKDFLDLPDAQQDPILEAWASAYLANLQVELEEAHARVAFAEAEINKLMENK